MAHAANPKIVLIGWDAADWKIADSLIEAGRMPNLKRLIASGTRGELSPIAPTLCPALWNSIATGKRPFRHGVLGLVEPDPLTASGIRLASNQSRTTRALWNILQLSGVRSNVTAWPCSCPTEPISGTMIADAFLRPPLPGQNSWDVPRQSVHPGTLTEKISSLRFHPEELDQATLELFVPKLKHLDPNHPLLSRLAAAIAEAVSVQAIATSLLQLESAGLNALCFSSLEQISRNFLKFHAPHAGSVPEADSEFFSGVVEAAYRLHDLMLGYVMHIAGPDAVLLLVSDHGSPAPAPNFRRPGMFVLSGPGIRAGDRLCGASVLDITPTILHLLQLPIGSDMDGAPLLNALISPRPIQTIPSWDLLEGNDGRLPAGTPADTSSHQAAIHRLAALKEIPAPADERQLNFESASQDHDFLLASAWLDAGHHGQAAQLLRSLVARNPRDPRFRLALVHVLQSGGQPTKSAELLASEPSWEHGSRCSGAAIQQALPDYLRAGQLLAEQRPADALSLLQNALRTSPRNVLLVERLAAAYLQLRDYPAAVDAFQTVLADTPNNLTCLLGLARCMLALQNPGQALIHTNDALEVRHNTADAHYLRAVALLGLRRPLEAAEALKLAIALNPRHPEARQKLATLARNLHGDPQRADHSRQQELPAHQNPTSTCSTSDSGMSRRVAVSCSRPSHEQYPLNPLTLTHPISESIVVVTGLPRSGTAMMLQVLAAGGLPVRISEFRAPDPRYTPEPSRELASLAGHAVRLLSPGIQHLPEAGGLNYGVILMLREISDILRSQHHILARLGKPLEAPEAEQIAASWKNQLLNIRQSLAARGIPILPLEYKHCLLDPRGTAIAIQNFLNTPLDIEAMAREIQPVFAGGKPPAVPVR